MKLFVVVGLCLILAGCGDSSSAISPPTNVAGSSLTGVVKGEDGAPLSGVQLVAMERVSHETRKATSEADGTFTLLLAGGVYDVGLDAEDDPTTATCFYGPLSVTGQQSHNFVVRNAGDRPAGQVFGRILSQDGLPAANRSISLRPGFAKNADVSLREAVLSSTTEADGSFQMELPFAADAGLDLELNNDDGTLDEFIDFGKKAKPCYLEISGQAGVKNRLRCNEADAPQSAPSNGVAGDIPFTTPIIPFTLQPQNLYDSPQDGTFLGGKFPLYQSTKRVLDIVRGDPKLLDDPTAWMYKTLSVGMTLDRHHSWYWGDYAIHLTAGLPTPFPLQWVFYDETGDYYTLAINDSSHGHIVNYKSARPAIVKFTTSH